MTEASVNGQNIPGEFHSKSEQCWVFHLELMMQGLDWLMV